MTGNKLASVIALAAGGCMVGSVADDVVDREADADPARLDQIETLLAANATTAGADVSADHDGDGIPDAVEELLLRRYRPVYRFSQDNGAVETYRPADAIAEIRNAQLREMTGTSGTTNPLPGCGRAGDAHLDPPDQLYTCRTDTSLAVTHAKTTYALNIADADYGGVSFAEAQAHATGLYGHVAPLVYDGHDAYQIEYWQFFAFNNQDISIFGLGSFGDHEGDWTSAQVIYDRVEHRIVLVRYLIHGKSATFAIPPNAGACRDCTIDLRGPNYNPNPPNFFADEAAYSDNQAEFYVDAAGYKHVVVYIERGAHEFWPGSWGHAEIDLGPFAVHLNPHNGEGPVYLVPDVTDRLLDAGEVGHPLTEEGRLVLPYDGFWGSTNTMEGILFGPQRRSPVGPALHCSWIWPDGHAPSGCEH